MKLPVYAITRTPDGTTVIKRVELDETELTPESNWTEAYPNSDPSSGCWAGRNLDAALQEIRRRLET